MSEIYCHSIVDRMLSCLIQNPTLCLDDKYKIDNNEFEIKFHSIIYATIYNLAIKGCEEISIMDICEFLEPYTPQKNCFNDNNGIDYINTIVELVEPNNFEFYYNEFKKMSCIRQYHNQGFDISKFWDFEKSLEKNLENINNFSINDIINYYDDVQITIKKDYLPKGYDLEETQAGDGLLDLKMKLQEVALYGHSFCSELLNTITRGQMNGQLCCFSSPSGTGKAQPIDTIIPTPNGNKKLGDIKVGDYVFDRLGNPTKVLGVFPQGKMDNYEVTLRDGRKTYCNNSHLWSVYKDHHSKNKELITIDLDEIIKRKKKNTVSIPTNKAIEYNEKKYDIDPYVIGSFLGNGCCKEKQLTISSNDIEQVNEVAKLLNAIPCKNSDKNYSWEFKYKDKNMQKEYNTRKDNIKFLTLKVFEKYVDNLCCYSYEKSIPNEYKYGSIKQRYSLLQGLFDTDGTIKDNSPRFTLSYSTTSEQLMKDIKEVLYSLGYSCSVKIDERSLCRKNIKNGHICYIISVLCDNKEKHKFFRLSRKKNIGLKANLVKSHRDYDRISIKDIRKMSEQKEMVCIYVDNEEHLYLTNDYIVTHNTTIAVSNMCKVCATKIWDYDTEQFIDNPTHTKNGGLYIQFELDNIQELSIKFLAYISGVKANIILDGKYTQDESNRIDIAIDILKESNIHLVYMPNFTKKLIDMTIKEHILKYGIDYVIYDYIQDGSSLNSEMNKSNGGIGLRTDQVLANLSDFLKLEARTYDIPIYTMTQTNANLGSGDVIGVESIAGSRAVANKLDVGGVLLPLRPKEQKASELILKELGVRGVGIKEPNYIYHMYKVRFGKYPQNIKVWVNIDLGTGRMIDCFCTDWQNKIINVNLTKLEK